jgi:DNA-binding LacI/PurR family transcriptional regulator
VSHTIEDIAAAARVSKATVSRVLNGTAQVSDSARQRVEAAIKKFDYQPNVNARKLAGGSGGSLALVLEESIENFFSNPFWRAVVDGFITEAAGKSQHPVLIFHTDNESDKSLVESLIRGNYDALAFFGWHRDIKNLEKFIPQKMRVVFGGRQGESSRFTYVGVDNFLGGKLATRHLIERGCKEILTITGDLSVESGRERLAGYKEALAEAGLKFKETNVLNGDYSGPSSSAAMTKFLAKKRNFDGIFAANDVMAVAAMQILKSRGIKVPNDVKVIGFDGSELSAQTNPPLSTIAQPSFELGRRVAEQLMLPRETVLKNIALPLELLARKSTN